jgi:hypothetical protein
MSCKIHGDKAEGAAFAFQVRDPSLSKERHAERCPARDGDIKGRRTFWREERNGQSRIELRSRAEFNLSDAGAVDFTEGHRLPASQASGHGRTQTGGQMGIVCCMGGWLSSWPPIRGLKSPFRICPRNLAKVTRR